MRILSIAIAVVFLAGCRRGVVVQDPLTAVEVIELSASGMPPEEIIERIDESRTIYVLDSEDIVNLHEQGVDTAVIEHMRKTRERAYDRDPYYAYPPYHYYHYPYFHPHFGFGFGYHCW